MTWLIYGIFKNMIQTTYLQNRNRLTDIENKSLVDKVVWVLGSDKRGLWD